MDLDSARMLVDPAAMQSLWGALPALQQRPIQDAEFAALWVKPGRHFNVSYRLTVPGSDGQVLAAACLMPARQAAELIRKIGPHRDENPLRCPHCCVVRAQPGLLLQLFPVDYRLPMLAVCLDAAHVGAALGLTLTGCVPVGYRPGMRCQIRYEGVVADVYGKVAVEHQAGHVIRLQTQVHEALAASPRRFAVAAPVGYLADLHLTLAAAVTGTSLHGALRGAVDILSAMPLVAEALADFHRLRLDAVARTYGVGEEIDLVSGWVDLVAALFPDLAPDLLACAGALARQAPAVRPPRAFVHRDFYDKQVILAGDTLHLLDLDTACLGDPEIDLGNFCAHLRLRGLQWRQPTRCRALEGSFLSAYPLSVEPTRIDWYRRASLLRLACGYTLRPQWRHLAPQLIAEAAA